MKAQHERALLTEKTREVSNRSRIVEFPARTIMGAIFAGMMLFPGAPRAEETPSFVANEVLVKFAPETTLGERAQVAALQEATIVKEQSILGYYKLRLEGDITVAEAIQRLALERAILWAEPNGFYEAVACPQDPFLVDAPDGTPENQWGIFKTGVFDLWRYGNASGAVIAIIDTGINSFTSPHPDLAANVGSTGLDLVDDDNNPTDEGSAAPGYGHGTHVAGIAAAEGNTVGIAGVNYEASILVVRVLDCNLGGQCPGTYEDIADGIQWAADQGADVINLSLGGAVPSNTVRTAVQYAIKEGSIVVAAAGNDGVAELSYPARYPETIAVGATNLSDDVASFSNWGPELDVVAPGVDIYSTIPGPSYGRKSGTSMATPFVSGIAALISVRNPAITQAEMESYLRGHATPLAGANAEKDGAGRVNFFGLSDWSDAPPPYPAAVHQNFAWEWLGDDASPEPSISDPLDADFVPNIGGPGASDGYDDGVFPGSIMTLPFLPPHLGLGTNELEARMIVSLFDGPRYGASPSKSLHLDVWADWDSDHAFETGTAAERTVTDATFNPGTWGGAGHTATLPVTPVDEHIMGNPLVIRSRLAYGASAGSPAGSADFGEVEDASVLNFVEEFDIGRRVHSPGIYMVMDGWAPAADPTPQCNNHGDWEFVTTPHPGGPFSDPCNGVIERVNILASPLMDWTEYTAAFVYVWYCHQFQPCSEAEDRCRFRIDRGGVKIDLGPVPPGSGSVVFDISDLTGSDAVIFEVVEETDFQGTIAIDDVVIWAYDGERPEAITDLGLARVAGANVLTIGWTAMDENEHIPSPPADPVANVYDIRYSKDPILTESEWRQATPFRPSEGAVGPPVPSTPGTAELVAFRAPSAFQAYSVSARIEDEMINLSLLSNSPGVSNAPTLGVTVVSLGDGVGAPGDTVSLDYRVTNTGNTPDQYAVSASDTRGWELIDDPGLVALDPAASSVFSMRVRVSLAASDGDQDTVTVTATSLADGTVSDSDSGVIEAESDPSSAPGEPENLVSALRLAGANPFSDQVALRLTLSESGPVSVSVFDSGGRLVQRLIDREWRTAGVHSIAWAGQDEENREAASGVYFVAARAGAWDERVRVLRTR